MGGIRNFCLAIGGCLLAMPAAAALPDEEKAGLDRLLRVVQLIGDEYVAPVDWPALAARGSEAVRLEAGLTQEGFGACLARSPPEEGPAQRAAVLALTTALECAKPSERPESPFDRLVTAALRAVLSGLDPFSHYYSREDVERMLGGDEAEPASAGLSFREQGTSMEIIATQPSSPARHGGIKAGETLLAIDGVPVAGRTLEAVRDMLRGPDSSAVVLTIRDSGGKAREVRLVLQVLDPLAAAVESEMRDDVLIVRLHSLGHGVAASLDQIVREQGEVARAMLLDLRANPGGLLTEAVAIADQFLARGDIVVSKGRTDKERYAARKGSLAPELPLTVLVDRDTASGAEIIAAALQDHRRARVVGQRSYGAGTVQTAFPLPEGHAVTLTTSNLYRPNGRPLGEAPVEPDCPLAEPDEARQLAAAVAVAEGKSEICPAAANAPPERTRRD